jgi:hypothetical protein
MKLKTLKLKVTNDQQEYDFSQFLTGSNTVYNTIAHFEKEGDECYWYVLITYEPQGFIPTPTTKKALPEGFEQEIKEYTEQNPPKSSRIKNNLMFYVERLIDVKEITDFSMFRNIGKQACANDAEYLTGLLAIIKKYQKN